MISVRLVGNLSVLGSIFGVYSEMPVLLGFDLGCCVGKYRAAREAAVVFVVLVVVVVSAGWIWGAVFR